MLIFPRSYFTKVIVFIVFPDVPSTYPPCSHPPPCVCRIFLAAVVVCDRWRHLVAPQYKGDNSRLLLGARRGAQWQAACVFPQPCLSLSHAGYQLEADAAHFFFFCGVGGRRWEENSWSRGVSSTERRVCVRGMLGERQAHSCRSLRRVVQSVSHFSTTTAHPSLLYLPLSLCPDLPS